MHLQSAIHALHWRSGIEVFDHGRNPILERRCRIAKPRVQRVVGPRANIKQLTKGLFLRLQVILFAGSILEGKGSLRPTRQSREGNHRLQRSRQGALDRAFEIPDPHILYSEYKGQI